MIRSSTPQEQQLFVTTQVVADTMQLLRSYRGPDGEQHEGIVYWLGLESSSGSAILSVIAPQAVTAPRSYRTTPEANARAVSGARSLGLSILVQVHSHPGANVSQSETDAEEAFMPFEGFYSVIVPHYARDVSFDPHVCGWYRFEHGALRRKPIGWVQQHVLVLPPWTDLRGR